MALERRNPLPAGFYWQDIFEKDSNAFDTWLGSNASAVKVIRTASFEANAGGDARQWVLFQVLSPVTWQGPGIPTIAAKGKDTQPDLPDLSATSPLAGLPGVFVVSVLGSLAAFWLWKKIGEHTDGTR